MRRHIGYCLAVISLTSWAAMAEEREQPEILPMAEVAGGVSLYSGGMAGLTKVGPAWAVRLDADTKYLGGEIGYFGSFNEIQENDLLGEDPGSIWKNGVSTLAKVGPLLGDRFRPYAGAGLGVSYLHPTQAAAPEFRDDVTFEIPLAVGVDYRAGLINAGIRGTWTPLVGLEVADSGPFVGTNGGLFLTTLSVGGSFY